MGELFRRTYTDKAGAEKVVSRWYGSYTDGNGIRRRVALAWVTAHNLVRKEIVPPKGGSGRPSDRYLAV